MWNGRAQHFFSLFAHTIDTITGFYAKCTEIASIFQIGRLQALKSLSLGNNCIKELPSEFGDLSEKVTK